MPDPAATPPGRPTLSARSFYHHGPLLVGHDNQPRARRLARGMYEECERREVAAEVLALADVLTTRNIAHYIGLVVITWPSPNASPFEVALRQPMAVVSAFRASRPHGLQDLQAGRVEWWRAGVTQIVTDPEIRRWPAGAEILDLACFVHDVNIASPPDLFAIYERPFGVNVGYGHYNFGQSQAQAHWDKIRAWGLTDFSQVEPMLEAIDRVQLLFRSPAKPSLSKPLPGSPLSRLDFVLNHQSYRPSGHYPTWSSDGGRAVREAIEELRKTFPTLGRPTQSKGAQPQFREFYRNLRRLAQYLKLNPESQWPES